MTQINKKPRPIQSRLMRVILVTCSVVLILTYASYFAYEFFTFRETTKAQLVTLGKVIATNSTAALAFDNRNDANEILDALKAEKSIVAACLYDKQGNYFAKFPTNLPNNELPSINVMQGYYFDGAFLQGFQPVIQNNSYLGTLYIKFDMSMLYSRFRLYGLVAFLIIALSFLVAYFLSKSLQKSISYPILELAQKARLISEYHDYSVRAIKTNGDELGVLTDAFNHMLTQIEVQNSEITSFSQSLEEKVKARTIELEKTNAKLEIVNEQLIRSNNDLEQFAYIASHDLQEPLRKIQIFSELAEKSIGDELLRTNYFSKIHASAKRMTELIKAVLNYSRLSKTGEQFEMIDLNQVVENVCTDFELLTTEKKATITKSNLPKITGIPLQINQLFLNLMSNSLKFSIKPPQIRISSRTLSKEETRTIDHLNAEIQYAEILFEDNGIGFEQQYADQIFTIFQRLHEKQDYEGTGIGLALCKKIVENHYGAITVHSIPGNGAAFKIYLPLH